MTWILWILAVVSSMASAEVQTLLHEQRLDHASRVDSRVFGQRYFIDSTYAQGDHAPVFLYVCGEGGCAPNWLKGVMLEAAKTFKGHAIALEHRYYGKSQPFSELTTENLRYLTIENAIDDAAHFIWQKQSELGGPWIAIGGSYAGYLAAFLRVRYPKLVRGALASSAPVYSKSSFYEFDEHLAKVAGQECASTIRNIIQQVEKDLTTPDKAAKLREQFQANLLSDDTDFLSYIADITGGAIQYGQRDPLCAAVKTSPSVESYAAFASKLAKDWHVTPESTSAKGAMGSAISMNRAWYYQLCTQFAGWQDANANRGLSVRSARLNSSYDRQICQRLYGILPVTDMSPRNREYYDRLFEPTTTNILFTDGSDDPWSVLSVDSHSNGRTNSGITIMNMKGQAHMEDISTPFEQASEPIRASRTLFFSLVETWIK
jgi:pimeloyl-ACP methyl ester carboxylesterase